MMNAKAEKNYSLRMPLKIEASGICCPLGYSAATATAAMRGRLNLFQQSQFVDNAGEPLICSKLLDVKTWGIERIAFMFHQALEECFNKIPKDKIAETLVLILAPEKTRPGTDESWSKRLLKEIRKGRNIHPDSKIYFLGSSGIANALSDASQYFIDNSKLQYILIIGADSLLSAGTITHYLANERLLTQDNSDGFIPGEGAASILLARATKQSKGLIILGQGYDVEKAHFLQDELPVRAVGLTQALRNASANAGMAIADCHFHLSNVNGCSWYAKEAALALTRAMERRVPTFPHQLIADQVGEIGAATGPLGLAYLYATLPRSDNIGSRAVFHLSNDDAKRIAMFVAYNS